MSGKIQIRLAVLAALAALVAVVVPSGLALGNHDGEGEIAVPGEVIYLKMGNPSSNDVITYGDLSQAIPTKKSDCTWINNRINTAGPNQILVVSPINAAKLGESKDHIGTKGPNDGSGEPCALAAAGQGTNGSNEGISIKLGTDADTAMSGFSIDIRLKFNSTVKAITYANGTPVDEAIPPFTMGPSDNGPDSADNFRWTYEAEEGKEFTEVRFVATSGAFALGGGVESDVPGAFDNTSFASQFQTVETFDGQITCGDTHIVDDNTDTVGVVTVRSMEFEGSEGFVTTNCLLKLYTDATGAARLAFVPTLTNTSARYTIDVTVENQPITVASGPTPPAGTITSLVAVYNADGDLTFPAGSSDPLQACNTTPVLADDPSTPGVNEYEVFWTQVDTGLLPAGETACFYHASVTPTSAGFGTEDWSIYFEDDPGFRF